MNKTFLKSSFSIIITIAVMSVGQIALADSTSGNLSTGIGATNGSTVDGIVVTAPVANPTAGVYTSTQNVSLSATGSIKIYFTLNDTTLPSCSSGTLYASPIVVSSSSVINAIACYNDGNGHSASSSIASYQYGINPPSTVVTTTSSGGGGGGGGSSSSGGSGNSSFLPGDANHDGHVNILDFVILMANWGQTGSGNIADFDNNGSVGITDFVILMANWTN